MTVIPRHQGRSSRFPKITKLQNDHRSLCINTPKKHPLSKWRLVKCSVRLLRTRMLRNLNINASRSPHAFRICNRKSGNEYESLVCSLTLKKMTDSIKLVD